MIVSFPYRLQKFPLFLSSSYRLQKFADTDRLRVNRRPIRKDFFPDRYDFVPIVFTSSSCKRGLTPSVTTVQSETNDLRKIGIKALGELAKDRLGHLSSRGRTEICRRHVDKLDREVYFSPRQACTSDEVFPRYNHTRSPSSVLGQPWG